MAVYSSSSSRRRRAFHLGRGKMRGRSSALGVANIYTRISPLYYAFWFGLAVRYRKPRFPVFSTADRR